VAAQAETAGLIAARTEALAAQQAERERADDLRAASENLAGRNGVAAERLAAAERALSATGAEATRAAAELDRLRARRDDAALALAGVETRGAEAAAALSALNARIDAAKSAPPAQARPAATPAVVE
jgi:chromosome segregation ATPase